MQVNARAQHEPNEIASGYLAKARKALDNLPDDPQAEDARPVIEAVVAAEHSEFGRCEAGALSPPCFKVMQDLYRLYPVSGGARRRIAAMMRAEAAPKAERAERKAAPPRAVPAEATQPKEERKSQAYRTIDSKVATFVRAGVPADAEDVNAMIRALTLDDQSRGYLAKAMTTAEAKPIFNLTQTEAKAKISKIVQAKARASREKKEGGNIVGVDDFTDLKRYAHAKLKEANDDDPKTFRYGSEIGKIQHVPEEGTTAVAVLNKDGLREEINRCATFYTVATDGESRGVSVPLDVVADLYQMDPLPLPYLRQVSTYPQFDAGGKLLKTNGYHAGAYLYMQLPEGLDVGRVSAKPTPEELAEAKRLIVAEWLSDFPFDGYTRRELLVSCGIEKPKAGEEKRPVPASFLSYVGFVLQPLVRPIIGPRPVPALLITKPEAGTGASKLVELAQQVVWGRTSTRTMPTNEDERGKSVFTALRGGDPFILFDNVAGSVDSPIMAALLTSATYTGRILGKSEEASIPNNASVAITGNNPRFTRELQRRLSLCRLDAGVAEPEKRSGFHKADLDGWTADNRGKLLWALCTLVLHWQAQGCPKPAGEPLGSYREWYITIGGILTAAGWDGWQSNRDQIGDVAGTDDDDPMRELVGQWYDAGTTRGGALALTGANGKELAAFADAREIDLPAARHVVDGERVFKPAAVGKYLAGQAGRVFEVDGVKVKLEKGRKTKHGVPWGLVIVK